MIRYEGDRSLAGNPIMANYEMEDATARLLYESGQIKGKAVKPIDAEQLAHFMGCSVRTEYLSDSPYSLCAVALENQTLRVNGKALVMAAGDIIVERAIVDRGEKQWYSYAIFHAIAHLYLHDEQESSGQLSFDLTATQSKRHFVCDMGELSDVLSDTRLDSRPISEGQADTFAGCLMLPKVPFKMAANAFMSKAGINRADLQGQVRDKMIKRLSRQFAAPEIAVALRLKKLLYL